MSHVHARGQGYLLSLTLLALSVRMLLGIPHPHLDWSQTALIGLTTVLLAAPAMYGTWFGESLLRSGMRRRYWSVTAAACGLFVYFIVLPG